MQNRVDPLSRDGIVTLGATAPTLAALDRRRRSFAGNFGGGLPESCSFGLRPAPRAPTSLPARDSSRSLMASRFRRLPRTHTPCHTVLLNMNVDGSKKQPSVVDRQ